MVGLMDGFQGMIALVDRHSGKTLEITFWESEGAMLLLRRLLTVCAKGQRRLVATR